MSKTSDWVIDDLNRRLAENPLPPMCRAPAIQVQPCETDLYVGNYWNSYRCTQSDWRWENVPVSEVLANGYVSPMTPPILETVQP